MSTEYLDQTTDTLAGQAVPPQVQYPGKPTTCDGAEAVVWVETQISQGSGAYPITSSTTMGSGFNQAVANGSTNLWGDPLLFFEPESEHSAATFCEGFALAGGRITNFTSGQGLVLMKEVLYTISGKRLPVVFNIGARALTSHSLNVHAGHDDVMSVADCGWGVLFGRNAQEACDLCLIGRRAAEASGTPFFNVQDGFLTTHTVESVRLPESEFMKEFIGSPADKLVNLMDPGNPVMSGVVQNQDSYMKGKIAQRWYYDQVGPALEDAFDEFYRKTGRRYDMVAPYRCDDAEYILVGIGCYMETAQTTIDYLRDKGVKAGCLNIYCFRPFPSRQIVDALKDLHGVYRSRADGRSPLHDWQSSHPRDQGGLLRCRHGTERVGKDRSHSEDLSRGRWSGEPRRAAWRHQRHLRKHDSARARLFLRGCQTRVGVAGRR